MNLRLLQRTTTLPLATLLAAGTLLAAPPPPDSKTAMTESAARAFERQASELLQETQTLAAKLHRDADTLESLARANQVGWEAHAFYRGQAREPITTMAVKLARLNDIRYGAASWQQQAIDRLYPVALELANRTEAAIVHLNENQNFLFDSDYKDHLATITDHAEQIKTSARDFLKLYETRKELLRLEQKLEATAS